MSPIDLIHHRRTQAAAAAHETATALSAEAEQWRQLRSADETKVAQADRGRGGWPLESLRSCRFQAGDEVLLITPGWVVHHNLTERICQGFHQRARVPNV